jgi:hypothetical protein
MVTPWEAIKLFMHRCGRFGKARSPGIFIPQSRRVLERFQRTCGITDEEVIDALTTVPRHFVDLVITAANVKTGTGAAVTANLQGSVATTQGQSVYQNASTPAQWALAQATTSLLSGVGSNGVGVAVNACSANQLLSVQTAGQITIGATVVADVFYVVSAAVAGNIAPIADMGAGNFTTMLGYAISTTVIQLSVLVTGIAHG